MTYVEPNPVYPVSPNTVYNRQQLATILQQAGWPSDQIDNAIGVIEAESGGHPMEVGWDYGGKTVADTSGASPTTKSGQAIPWSSYDTGLFQINSSNNPSNPTGGAYDTNWISSLQNPVANANEAFQLWSASGWAPWANDTYVQSHQLADTASGGSGVAGPTTGQGAGSSSATSGGSTSTIQAAGFLKWLQNLLNPQFQGANANPLDLFGAANALSDSAKVVQLVISRGAFVAIGGILVMGGIATLLITAATSSPVENAALNVGRAQRLVLAPQRLANEKARIANVQQRNELAQAKINAPKVPTVIEHKVHRTSESEAHVHHHSEPHKTKYSEAHIYHHTGQGTSHTSKHSGDDGRIEGSYD